MAKAKEPRKRRGTAKGTASGTSAPEGIKAIENATPAPETGKVLTHETPTVNVSSPVQVAAEGIPSLQGIPIIPLNSKETELIARLGELDYATLRDMAVERIWQAEVIRTGREIENWNEYEWYEKLKADLVWEDVSEAKQQKRVAMELVRLLEEASVLEKESDNRHPPIKKFEEPPEWKVPAQGIASGKAETVRVLTPVERADTLIGAPVAGAARPASAAAKPAAPSGKNDIITAMIPPEEDFNTYGNMFRTVGHVHLESGEKYESGKPEEFGKELERAIGLAEKIASGAGELSPDMQRVEKLRNFRKEFFEIEEGKEAPQKDFDAYRLWLERKRMDFKEQAEGAFEALGILPGEYGREGTIRVCDAALRGGKLNSAEQMQVFALMRMLEAKKPEGDVDGAAAKRNADLDYELVVGFGEKKHRELGEARVAEILRLEEKLKEKKFESAAHRDKMAQMASVLSQVHIINRVGEETTGKVTRDVREQLGRIEEDYQRREKLIRSLFTAFAGEGAAGAELMEQAEKAALANLSARNIDTGRMRVAKESVPKQQGHAPKGIGIAVGAAVGVAVFTAGMFASQYLGGNKAENEAQMPAVVQVENAVRKIVEMPPAIVPMGAKEISANKDAGVSDAGAEAVASAEKEAAAPEKYSRDKEGLKKALDDWCKEERGLLVDGKMLRASYAAIEGQLDGSVLPMDLEWVPLMLERKFPNRLIELAIMSDVARSEIEHADKYAALMRLSTPLGDRARLTKSFITIVEEANASGIELPRIDKNSHLGKIEGAKTGRACLAAAYFGSVSEMMDDVRKGALESGMDKKLFRREVRIALGEDAKELEKAYERAKSAARAEKATPGCKLLSGGKNGFVALTRAYNLSKRWIKRTERDRRRQEELDDILGTAPPQVKASAKPGKAAPAASSCAGLQGIEYLSCASKQNAERDRAKKDTGEKKMHAPKGKESGAVSKSPKMLLR